MRSIYSRSVGPLLLMACLATQSVSAQASDRNLFRSPSPAGCFIHIERAGQDLRHQLNYFAYIVSRYERYGATQLAAEQASRRVGGFEYQVSRTCSPSRLLVLRDQVRDSLDPVRKAFRASSVLSSKADAFAGFRDMVDRWEILRDLVTDANEPVRGCYDQIAASASNLESSLRELIRIVSRIEFRSYTEFVAGNAAREVAAQVSVLQTTCNRMDVISGRDAVRDRLDAVRKAFRSSSNLSNHPEAFAGFRAMVNSWEHYRDLVSDI